MTEPEYPSDALAAELNLTAPVEEPPYDIGVSWPPSSPPDHECVPSEPSSLEAAVLAVVDQGAGFKAPPTNDPPYNTRYVKGIGTVRDCLDCRQEVAGGPTRCGDCAAASLNDCVIIDGVVVPRDQLFARRAEDKPSNPKQEVANTHVKFSALPLRVLAGIAVGMTEGAYKYRRHNYRVAGVKASAYFDSTMDHLLAWFEGQDIDPDSGRHHIDKALASLFVLRDAMLGGLMTDDRPPAVENDWVKEAHAATKDLFDRMARTHGEHKPPYTIEGDRQEPERGGK